MVKARQGKVLWGHMSPQAGSRAHRSCPSRVYCWGAVGPAGAGPSPSPPQHLLRGARGGTPQLKRRWHGDIRHQEHRQHRGLEALEGQEPAQGGDSMGDMEQQGHKVCGQGMGGQQGHEEHK